MKKSLRFIFGVLFIILTSCTNSTTTSNVEKSDDNIISMSKEGDESVDMILTLKIGDTIVDVNWLDNESVKDLKKHINNELTIKLHKYGNFEQTGLLGFELVSNDTNMDVIPGDIVLYNSNQICLYYDNNSWAFTKLGHINLSDLKLKELLAKEDNVTITLSLK